MKIMLGLFCGRTILFLNKNDGPDLPLVAQISLLYSIFYLTFNGNVRIIIILEQGFEIFRTQLLKNYNIMSSSKTDQIWLHFEQFD